MSQGTNPTYNGEGKTTLLNMIHSAPDKAELTGYKPYITGVLTSGDAADDSFLRNHLGRVYYSSLHYAGLDNLIGDSVDGSFRPITLTGLYEGTPSAAGDVYFNSVVLQLSFDGADEATTSTDDSNIENTVNFVNGAELDTAYQKFGTASAKFDGTNDTVSIPYMEETEFGNIDFTIEGWFRSQAAGNQILCSQGNGSNGFWILINPGSNILSFRPYGAVAYDSQMTSQTINQDQWHHFAVSKSGTTSYLWIDGAGGTTATHNGGLTNDANTAFTIGGYYANSDWFNGHIDEFRFTTGVARYTEAFTPSTSAFPES